MAFPRFLPKSPASFLMISCFIAQPIDCQQDIEELSPPGITASATTDTWRPVLFGHDGLTIANRNGTSKVRIHGYLGADGRFFATNFKDQPHNVLLFRRVRPIVEGKLANTVNFLFMPDFGEGNAVVQEVYVQFQPMPAVSVNVGKFKTPIGLEVLRSDRDLTFPERSLASDLIPLRDLGAQIEGVFLQGTTTFQVGYFSGAVDGANANFEWRGTNEAVARIFIQPFVTTRRAALQQLGVGMAASEGNSQGALPTFNTIGQQTFFRYTGGALADGAHKRVSPQAYYFFQSFELLAEYISSGQTVAAGTAHRYLSNRGWEVSGAIVLTGEKSSYSGVQPAHPFEPSAGLQHMGAWQIAFRHSALGVDRGAFPQYALPENSARHASESAAGLTWYLNRHTKLTADYEYTTFQIGTDSVARLSSERVLVTRLQLAF